jgi:hypothetical protein
VSLIGGPGSGPHPLEELSALLDGELPEADAREIRDHLRYCRSCRAERDRLAQARAALRSMAGLDPPAGLPERTAGRFRRVVRRTAAGATAAGATAAALLVVVAPPRPVGSPLPTLDVASVQMAPPGVPLDPTQVPADYATPAELDSMPLNSVRSMQEMVGAFYGSGGRQLAVFEETGELRLDRGNGKRFRPTSLAGRPGFLFQFSGPGSEVQAFTWQSGGDVMTVVGSPADLAPAAYSLDRAPRHQSFLDRARELSRDLIEDLTGA